MFTPRRVDGCKEKEGESKSLTLYLRSSSLENGFGDSSSLSSLYIQQEPW